MPEYRCVVTFSVEDQTVVYVTAENEFNAEDEAEQAVYDANGGEVEVFHIEAHLAYPLTEAELQEYEHHTDGVGS